MSKQSGSVLIPVIVAILIALGIAALLYFKNNGSTAPIDFNTATSGSLLKEEYTNPFDSSASSTEKDSYQNPFSSSDYENPFDSL